MHRRPTLRLPQYDYASSGAYFVTICTHEGQYMFGEIENGEMQLNQFGQIIVEIWESAQRIRNEIELDEYVIMPNHFHGIVWIMDDRATSDSVGRAHIHAPVRRPRSLSTLVSGFKSVATARINTIRATPGIPVWHRNYYDHIIRNELDLNRIRQYVLDNPKNWALDSQDSSIVRAHGYAPSDGLAADRKLGHFGPVNIS